MQVYIHRRLVTVGVAITAMDESMNLQLGVLLACFVAHGERKVEEAVSRKVAVKAAVEAAV
jgi:hypothetical protein